MNPLQQIEQQTLEEGREWTRRLLQQRLQAAVDQIGPVSPLSGLKLKRARRVHWHEIKSAVIFRLNQRAQSATGRRILVKKHAVAVPAETEPTAFASQVHAEAMRLGLAAAKKVYVVQDGAIWLWNVFEDRFSKCATGTLDFYHASDHLWALANDLFGQGSAEAKRWVLPLLHQLRHGGESRVLRSLAELVQSAQESHPQSVELITNTENYFRRHVGCGTDPGRCPGA